MWQSEHIADSDLAPDAVWAALRGLQTGTIPLSSGDLCELNGSFAVGSTISVTPAGLSTLESTIVELVPNQVLATRTNFNGLILLLRHTLNPLADGGTRITRALEIGGEQADEQGPVVGPRINADYPEALAEIITHAKATSTVS